MIVFQISLNFDPVKEILKIQCQIYRYYSKKLFLKILLISQENTCVGVFF